VHGKPNSTLKNRKQTTMNQVTIKQLQAQIERLNQLTGNPLAPYTRSDDGKLHGNVGNFHLSQAYGGVCVHRMANDCGGVTTPIFHGHRPKREAFGLLVSYIAGIESTRDA
jgi:hypothetical protein